MPDFREKDLDEAIEFFQSRSRRYGGLELAQATVEVTEMMRARVLVGLIGAPIGICVLWMGGAPLALVAAIIAAIGGWSMPGCAGRKHGPRASL